MLFRPVLAAAAIASLLLAQAAPAAAQTSLQRRLAHALRARHVDPGKTGAVVLDLQTGRVVYGLHPGRALLPASNEKLATTYAALTALGPSFRIETDVLGDGTLSGKTWRGDLVLKGYGDPSLSSAKLMSLARQVAAGGITRVAGRIVGDQSWFDDRRSGLGWKPSFFLTESPALSALIVDRGWTGSDETAYPALAATRLFRRDLFRVGVKVSKRAVLGSAAAAAVPIAYVESPPLGALIRHMDLYSDNFYAEMLLKEVGAVHAAGGSAPAGIGVARQLLAAGGVPLDGVRIVDGSGLSLLDRWTPRALATLLRSMWLDPDLRPYIVAALPVAGRSGTLAHRMRKGPAHGLVRAKTGTTDNSSALSGFVGDRYVFSVVENGNPVRTANAERTQDRFSQVLARAARR